MPKVIIIIFSFGSRFTAISRIFHLYWANRSSKVGEYPEKNHLTFHKNLSFSHVTWARLERTAVGDLMIWSQPSLPLVDTHSEENEFPILSKKPSLFSHQHAGILIIYVDIYIWNICLTLKVPRNILQQTTIYFCFLFFRENNTWHYMWIVCPTRLMLITVMKYALAAFR